MEENNSLQWLSCERETGTQREREGGVGEVEGDIEMKRDRQVG